MFTMKAFPLLVLWFYFGNFTVCFKVEQDNRVLEHPAVGFLNLLKLDDSLNLKEVVSNGVNELFIDYARKIYHHISLHDDDESMIERNDGAKKDLVRVQFLQGIIHDGDVQFDTTELPKGFSVSYAELVFLSYKANSKQFSESESRRNYVVTDVTRDFLHVCGRHAFNCVYRHNYKALGQDHTIGQLVVFENMNRTMLSTIKTRDKRETTESYKHHGGGSRKGCSVQPWVVNFTDIGWDGWLVLPPSYQANTCSGHCHLDSTIDLFSSLALVKKGYQIAGHKRSKALHVCCAPTEYKPLTLLYMTKSGTVSVKQVSRMKVTACGCT